MTSRHGAGVSFLLLLAILFVAWQIVKPEARQRPDQRSPVIGAAPVTATRATRSNESETVPAAPKGAMAQDTEGRSSASRTVWFHVTTTEGAPIGDACALAVPSDRRVARTDADGNGSIESAAGIRAIRFVAPGFELEEVVVAPETESLEVELEPAAMVTIRVTTPAGLAGAQSTTIVIETTGSPCAIETSDALWTAVGNARPKMAGLRYGNVVSRADPAVLRNVGRQRVRHTVMLTFRDDTVRLCPVHAGPMKITVRHDLQDEPIEREVQVTATESMVVDIPLPGDFGRLSGRVVGEAGEPVSGATVTVADKATAHPDEGGPGSVRSEFFITTRAMEMGGNKSASAATDAEGVFDLGAVPVRAFDLTVSADAHAFWSSIGHQITRDLTPMTITLDGGHAVKIKIVDADGQALKGTSVWAHDRYGKSDAEGLVSLTHLPRGVVNFDTFYGGIRTTFRHDVAVPDATFQIEYSRR